MVDQGAADIGYQPRDDAEKWATATGEPDPDGPGCGVVGGGMPDKPLGRGED